MTRIGNVDQVLLLLREQLERSGRSRGTARRAAPSAASSGDARPIERARSLAALDALSDEEARRALVRGLLVEQFGEGTGNDPAFQQVIDDVFRIIADTPEGAQLMARALEQLRKG